MTGRSQEKRAPTLWNRVDDGTVFEDQDWSGSTITRLDADRCVFRACRFVRASILDSVFSSCRFERCDFSNADISGSSFDRVTFVESKAVGVNWELAIGLTLHVSFDRCDLRYASFRRLSLQDTDFIECRLRDSDFSDADLRRANFRGSDLSGAQFLRSRLQHADLTEAHGYWVDPRTNEIAHAQFSLAGAIMLAQLFEIDVPAVSGGDS